MSVRAPTISAEMFLHVSAQTSPLRSGAAQGGQKMKVGVFGSEMFKLPTIVNVLLAAGAEQQPELVFVMTVVLREQPMQHGAKRSDPVPLAMNAVSRKGGRKMKSPNGP